MVFVVAAIALVIVERRAKLPLLPMKLLSRNPQGNLNWANTLGAALSAASNFNIPLFLQAVKQLSPTQSGVLLLSPLAGVSFTSVVVGFAVSRTGKLKPFIAVGAVLQLLGIVACGMLQKHIPTVAFIPIIPWVSIGQGFLNPASTVSTLSMSTADDQAIVVTTLNLARSVGNILGVAISSWVLQNALLVFLNKSISGSHTERMRIIRQLRQSVQVIAVLDPVHKREGRLGPIEHEDIH